MNIAIGGWLLLAVAGSGQPMTVDQIVSTGLVQHGFDSADECERERAKFRRSGPTVVCLPALALINR